MSVAICFEHVCKRYMDHAFLSGGLKNSLLNLFRERHYEHNRRGPVLEDISLTIEHGSTVVSFAELEEHIDVPIRFYSSGMVARLGFAVVSQLDPEILLIDEVLAVGDLAFQAKCFEVIDRFHAARGTIVLVSHSVDDIIRLCDQAFLIDNHRIAASGGPHEVMQRYRPEAAV
jgi:ABC-type polysaccharide/polyol phosphate transport system ATPase subunit